MNITIDDIKEYIKNNSIDINTIAESLNENRPIKSLGILYIGGNKGYYDYFLDSIRRAKFEPLMVTIRGPKHSLYEKGIFKVHIYYHPINVPEEYPEIKFITPIVHLQVNQYGGNIDAVFLREYRKSPRAPTYELFVQILVGLYLFLQKEDQNGDYA